jgi:hypothetical protein
VTFFLVMLGLALPSSAGAATTAHTSSAHAQSVGGGSDATGDQTGGNCQGDIVNWSADYSTNLYLSLSTACATDPSGSNWNPGSTDIEFALDVDNNDKADYLIVLDNTGTYAVTVFALNNETTLTQICGGTAGWNGSNVFSAIVASSCLGDRPTIRVNTYMTYDEAPMAADCVCGEDSAPDGNGFSGPISKSLPPPPTRQVTSNGYVLDGWGGLHGWSTNKAKPADPEGGPYWSGWDIARGVSVQKPGLTPDSQTMPYVWGAVVDGWGAAHIFRVATGSAAPEPSGCTHDLNNRPTIVQGPYWAGWDIVRDIAIFPQDPTNCSLVQGFILDGWGALHYFSTQQTTAPTVHGNKYWSGYDIARGVALNSNASGGYILDGFGGQWEFGVNGGVQPQTQYGPYWSGWDITAGNAILPDNTGGFIADDWGGIHPFDIVNDPDSQPVGPTNGPYWSGWNIARGIAIVS